MGYTQPSSSDDAGSYMKLKGRSLRSSTRVHKATVLVGIPDGGHCPGAPDSFAQLKDGGQMSGELGNMWHTVLFHIIHHCRCSNMFGFTPIEPLD